MKPIDINFATLTQRHHKKTVGLMVVLLICSIYLTINNIYNFYSQQSAIDQYKIKIEQHASANTMKDVKNKIKDKNGISEKEDSITKSDRRFSPSEIEALKADVHFLNRLLSYRSFPWIDTLNKIELLIDDGIRFNYINIERDSKKLTLKGVADSAENLSSFIKSISSENLFLLNSISQESKQGGVINFDMGLTIR
ncbi:MAG: PilN domain-containing protein [Desulfamplus sp.]